MFFYLFKPIPFDIHHHVIRQATCCVGLLIELTDTNKAGAYAFRMQTNDILCTNRIIAKILNARGRSHFIAVDLNFGSLYLSRSTP
jgi:hypothetical protein